LISFLQQHFIYPYGTHTAQKPASLFLCDAAMSLQFTHVHFFVCRLALRNIVLLLLLIA